MSQLAQLVFIDYWYISYLATGIVCLIWLIHKATPEELEELNDSAAIGMIILWPLAAVLWASLELGKPRTKRHRKAKGYTLARFWEELWFWLNLTGKGN